MPMNSASNFGLIAFRSIIIDGNESVVTAIMKDNMTPSCAPLESSASAIGIVPKISAYIGTPINVAMITPRGLLLPRAVAIHSSGIQLWMTAPMPTPINIYIESPFLKL